MKTENFTAKSRIMRRSKIVFSKIFFCLLAVSILTRQIHAFQSPVKQCFHQSTSTTKLFLAQKKKPRFTQQAHVAEQQQQQQQQRLQNQWDDNGTASPKRRNGERKMFSRPTQPWETGKSIEELEVSMMKKFGAIEESKSKADKPAKFQRHRRAVLDPWERKEKGNDRVTRVREYYDEDDEGFEYIEEDDEDDDNSSPSVMQVKHLISPKPAGGQGSFETPSRNSALHSGSYFFNPDAAVNKAKNELVRKEKDASERERRSKKQTESLNIDDRMENEENQSPKRPRSVEALLDEGGNPRLLTVDEALRQFQDTVDEGTMEIIETAEVPIVACTQSQSWQDLGITNEILLGNLAYMNCTTPLAVQEKTTPAILTGNGVLVGTYTGSGKTLSFLAPLIQRLLWSMDDSKDDNLGLAVLIVAPGRELASQIACVARALLQDTGLSVQLAIGGTTFSRNVEQIRKRKPNIVVGTPGRIAELVVGKPGEKSGKLKIGSLQTLVLDEFDALLEYKPHREPTRAIMQILKRRHGDSLQSVLCSATATDIMDSAKVKEFLRPGYETAMTDDGDVLVTESNDKQAPQVSRTVLHGVVHLEHRRFALDAVRKILHTEPIAQQILIFVENARKVEIVVEKLAERGIIAAPLHGGTGSEKQDRAEVSRALREGYVGIVVATEMAARGLDAPLLTHVINMDLPTDSSHYAHRAGRCGRGGRPGVVINLTTSPKEKNVPKRFASQLGVDLYTVEPRNGKLLIMDVETESRDS
jgi:superfamily II DNA/RNA helicase